MTRNYQDNDVLIENILETKSNSELARNLPEDTLESKNDNHDNDVKSKQVLIQS